MRWMRSACFEMNFRAHNRHLLLVGAQAVAFAFVARTSISWPLYLTDSLPGM